MFVFPILGIEPRALHNEVLFFLMTPHIHCSVYVVVLVINPIRRLQQDPYEV